MNWEAFGRAVLAQANEHVDVDGGWLQEEAVKHGVLIEITVTAPCNTEHCVCAEFGFPTSCFRIPDAS